MNEFEKKMCEFVLENGEVLQKIDTISCEGIHVEGFLVKYEGEEYHLTKNDGEWIYFLHC